MNTQEVKITNLSGKEYTFRLHLLPAAQANFIMFQLPTRRHLTDFETYQRTMEDLVAPTTLLKTIDDPNSPTGQTIHELPVFKGGKFVTPEIEQYDLYVLNALYKAAYDFNFGPFLRKLIEEEEARRAKSS